MKVDIQDVLFWMDAIRNSEDKYRTLESFWKGQVNSKVWLATELYSTISKTKQNSIVIYGGWNGVLASILFNSRLPLNSITSVDIDPVCEDIANTINKRYEMQGKFSAITTDMCGFETSADVVINTSCEHITQEQYEQWLSNQPNDATIVLQSNNYFDLDEHIRCSTDLADFTIMSKIKPYFRGIFPTPKYDRYMLIGKKK